MDREISFSWNMIKKRGMFESTDLISTPNLVCVLPLRCFLLLLLLFLQCICLYSLHICVFAVVAFPGIVLSTNIYCCIGVDKYSWASLVIATFANAKLSHISMYIMTCGCTFACVSMCPYRMTQFGWTCFTLFFTFSYSFIWLDVQKKATADTRTHTYSKHMNAL